jgi:hypothetical protein
MTCRAPFLRRHRPIREIEIASARAWRSLLGVHAAVARKSHSDNLHVLGPSEPQFDLVNG